MKLEVGTLKTVVSTQVAVCNHLIQVYIQLSLKSLDQSTTLIARNVFTTRHLTLSPSYSRKRLPRFPLLPHHTGRWQPPNTMCLDNSTY